MNCLGRAVATRLTAPAYLLRSVGRRGLALSSGELECSTTNADARNTYEAFRDEVLSQGPNLFHLAQRITEHDNKWCMGTRAAPCRIMRACLGVCSISASPHQRARARLHAPALTHRTRTECLLSTAFRDQFCSGRSPGDFEQPSVIAGDRELPRARVLLRDRSKRSRAMRRCRRGHARSGAGQPAGYAVREAVQ